MSNAPSSLLGFVRVPRHAGAPKVGFDVRIDFNDPYLELLRLLTEAAVLEHSLMVSYLYAMFSIKDDYAKVRGNVNGRSFLKHDMSGQGEELEHEFHSFLDVALEEMQHLGLVNALLGELGAAPNLTPHGFPLSADIYPFPLEPAWLSREVAARYMWIEADDHALDPGWKHSHKQRRLIVEVRRILGIGPDVPAHLGSVYGTIVDYALIVAHEPPAFLPPTFPWGKWIDRLTAIRYQGEMAHFNFFSDVFSGLAFGGDEKIWDDAGATAFPTRPLLRGTAYRGRPDTLCEPARSIAWLANLHYWIVLMLLDVTYRGLDRRMRYKAIDSMTQALWWLGLDLAARNAGMPFDPLGPTYAMGRDAQASIAIVRRYAREAERFARALAAQGNLPAGYDLRVFAPLLAGLGTGELVLTRA